MSLENPSSIFYDAKGVEIAVSHSQVLEPNLSGSEAQPGLLLAGSGSDGVVRFLKVSNEGNLFITGSLTSEVTVGAVDQGNHGSADQSWYTVITDGTSSNALGTPSFPFIISGTVANEGPAGTEQDPIAVSGTLNVISSGEETTDASTVTYISASTTSVVLAASNAARQQLLFFNESTKVAWVKLGVSASRVSFSARVSGKGFWEMPRRYNGEVTALWDSAGGPTPYGLVTELE